VVPSSADVVGQQRIADRLRPIEQEIVVIEDVVLLLGLDIGRKQFTQLLFPAGAPGETASQHVIERRFRVNGARIDGETCALGRKPTLGLGEAEVVPNQVHQVGRILAIVDGEVGMEPDLLGIVAQQPRADAVEGARPGQRVGHDVGALTHHLSRDPLHPPRHLGCGPARECHQQNPARIGAIDDQVGDAMRQGVGLARSGTRDDEERCPGRAVLCLDAMLDGPAAVRS
jgi:hypothetical protein